MAQKSSQSAPVKRPSRISPVIKADGVRLGGEAKVEVAPHTLGDRREVSLPVLEALKERHEKLFDSLGARLSLFLRADVVLTLEEFSAAKYGKISEKIGDNFHMNVFRADAATGAGFFGLTAQVALAAVNLLLGGKGDAPKDSRPLTTIESDLSGDVVNEFLSGWKVLAKDAMEFNPAVDRDEKAPVASLCDPHTGVFCATFKMKIKEFEGEGCLVFPVHMIESVIRRLEETAGSRKEKGQPLTSQWSPVYGSVPVRPDVRVPAGQMTVEEFLALEPGAVLPLSDDAMERARMHLDGQSLFGGHFGVDGERLALSLKEKF